MKLSLKCHCGNIQGEITQVTPKSGSRAVCYCRDCQAFAKQLGKASEVLNEFGGTEVYQVTPAQIKIHRGVEHIGRLKLTAQGIDRWYASCCNTPMGNTTKASMPFVSVIANFIVDDNYVVAKVGPILGSINIKDALGRIPQAQLGLRSPRRLVLIVLFKLLRWKLLGKHKPHPFYTEAGEAIVAAKLCD